MTRWTKRRKMDGIVKAFNALIRAGKMRKQAELEIRQQHGVPASTLKYWLRKLGWAFRDQEAA